MQQKTFTTLQWSLFLLAVLLPVLAWGSEHSWQISALTGYQWFPLFGLLAWLIMWTHYITAVPKIMHPSLKTSRTYQKISAWLVLFSLLMHPAILAYMQLQNEQGLPPASFVNYVGEGLALAVMFGSVSLLIFLSFEVFDRIKNRDFIKRNWLYISLSQSLAMLLIFVHAIRLGSVVGDGWFAAVWYVCGLLLLPCFYLIHKADLAEKQPNKTE
jgi:hypothetical protein